MNRIAPSPRAPQSWVDAIEQGESDLAAGRTLDFEEVMREFDAEDAAELEAAAKAPDRGSQRPAAAR